MSNKGGTPRKGAPDKRHTTTARKQHKVQSCNPANVRPVATQCSQGPLLLFIFQICEPVCRDKSVYIIHPETRAVCVPNKGHRSRELKNTRSLTRGDRTNYGQLQLVRSLLASSSDVYAQCKLAAAAQRLLDQEDDGGSSSDFRFSPLSIYLG